MSKSKKPITVESLQEAGLAGNPPAVPPASASPRASSVQLDVPLGELGDGYITMHLDLHCTREQAAAARRLQEALDRQGARLKNGKRVTTAPAAVQWLLEALATTAAV